MWKSVNMSKLLCLVLCVAPVLCQFGFFPQRDNRRITPASPFGLIQNVIPDSNRIRNTLSGILHYQPGNVVNNQNNGQNDYNNRPYGYDNYNNRPNYNDNGPYGYDNYNNRPNYDYQPNRQNNVRFPVNVPNDDVNFETQTSNNEVNQNPGLISGHVVENPGLVSGTVGDNPGLVSGTVGENPGLVSGSVGDNPGLVSGTVGENPVLVSGTVGENTGLVSGTVNQDQGYGFGQKDTTEEPGYGKDSGLISDTQYGLTSGSKFGEGEGGLISGTVSTTQQGDVAFGNRNGLNSGTSDRAFDEPCQTVDGGSGNCISLTGCEPYLQLIKTARTNAKSRMTLQRSQCGFDGNLPKVCCPLPGIPTLPPTEATTTTTTTTTTTAATPVAKTADDSEFVAAFPEPPVCGVSGGQFGKVVGGVDANLGDFPWIAILGYQDKRDQSTRWRCGGSLVTDRHVLSAAHCVHNHEDDLYVVRLGELDVSRDDDGASPIDVLIKTKIKHELYNPKSFENDIAVLLLQNTVQFTKFINPICLPFTGSLRTQKFERLTPMIAGWGDVQFRGPSATHLQVVQLPVQTNDLCKKSYEKYPRQVIDDRVLCAGYRQGGKDACQGDSGGPLMLPNWNNVTFKVYFYQIGVVSYGKNCAEAGFPGVYSRTTYFMPWLEKVILGRS